MLDKLQLKIRTSIVELFCRLFVSEEDFYFLKDIFTLRIYFFGIIFLIIPQTRELAIILSPLMLLLTGFYCLYPIIIKRSKEVRLLTFLLLIAFSTILIEAAGVYTGLIFGVYSYGDVLGIKMLDVPVIIGLNWVIVILGTTHLAKKLVDNKFLVALYAGVFAVVFDFFLEPIAVKFNFWNWDNGIIPLQNYVAWFVITFSFSLVLQSLFSLKYTIRSGYAMIYQTFFFFTLVILYFFGAII